LGKHKAYYSDHRDAGDFVLVEYSYSGYKGNVKQVTRDLLMKNNPAKLLTAVVRGMLSKNKLRDKRIKRMKLVVGTTAQYDHFKPITLSK
jgi:large subunit ribosomal protein L13